MNPHPPVSTLYLNNVGVSPALMGLVVLGVLKQDLVHVSAGILEQLVGVVEDDESDLTVAQDAQLVRLLHQTKLPLGESHLVWKGNKSWSLDKLLAIQDIFIHRI